MQTAKELCDELGRNDIIPKIPLKDRKDSAEILHKGNIKEILFSFKKKNSFRERKKLMKIPIYINRFPNFLFEIVMLM